MATPSLMIVGILSLLCFVHFPVPAQEIHFNNNAGGIIFGSQKDVQLSHSAEGELTFTGNLKFPVNTSILMEPEYSYAPSERGLGGNASEGDQSLIIELNFAYFDSISTQLKQLKDGTDQQVVNLRELDPAWMGQPGRLCRVKQHLVVTSGMVRLNSTWVNPHKIAIVPLADFSVGSALVMDLAEHVASASVRGNSALTPTAWRSYVLMGQPDRMLRIDLNNLVVSAVEVVYYTSQGNFDPSVAVYGDYAFIVPYRTGTIFRLDLVAFNSSASSITGPFNLGTGSQSFINMFQAGAHAFLVPYFPTGGPIVRAHLTNFTATSFTQLDPEQASPDLWARYQGAFASGSHLYFFPREKHWNNGFTFTGKVVRIPKSDFSLEGVEVLDLAFSDPTDANLQGWDGVFARGSFAYLINFNPSKTHLMTKIDLTQIEEGADGIEYLSLGLNASQFQVTSGLAHLHHGYLCIGDYYNGNAMIVKFKL